MTVFAGPQSSTYELKQWTFGNGGAINNNSSNYSFFGSTGETTNGSINSSNYTQGDGLIYMMQSYVPPSPNFSNPSSNYDRLKFILDSGNNPTDAEFLIAFSKDSFTTTYYVQADGTVGSSQVWQTYSAWGGVGGMYIVGLSNNTTYQIKVKSRQGKYTESPFGVVASATTSDPTLSFGINTASITFNNLNAGNSFTDSSQSTILTTSTNAYNGYVVYAHETQPLTFNGTTISDYSSPNSAPSSWSGAGFGYTTNCTDLIGSGANRFNNGTYYAGFVTSVPGDPVASHAGPILSAINSEQFTISYRVTASSTKPAGNYQSTIIYVVVPTY